MAHRATTLVVTAIGAYLLGRLGTPVGEGVACSAAPPPDSAPLRDAAAIATPGAHHHELDGLVGTWNAEVTVRSMVDGPATLIRGTVNRAWVLGGRFLRETTVLGEGEARVEQLAYIGFDNFDGQYQVVRMDTASTAMRCGTGTLHPGERVMHVTGGRRDPATGRLVNGWTKLDSSDPERHVLIEYQTDEQGRTFRAAETVLTRAATQPR